MLISLTVLLAFIATSLSAIPSECSDVKGCPLPAKRGIETMSNYSLRPGMIWDTGSTKNIARWWLLDFFRSITYTDRLSWMVYEIPSLKLATSLDIRHTPVSSIELKDVNAKVGHSISLNSRHSRRRILQAGSKPAGSTTTSALPISGTTFDSYLKIDLSLKKLTCPTDILSYANVHCSEFCPDYPYVMPLADTCSKCDLNTDIRYDQVMYCYAAPATSAYVVPGYFYDTAENVWQACHPTCRTCTAADTYKCTACWDGATTPDSNIRILQFSLNDPPSTAVATCSNTVNGCASPGCLECSAIDSVICHKCDGGFMMTENRECVICDTSNGFYQYNNATSQFALCGRCPINCKQCKNSFTCDKCIPGSTLNANSQCIKDCISQGSCLTCDISSVGSCTTCHAGDYLDQTTSNKGKCIACDQPGEFILGGACISTGQNCLNPSPLDLSLCDVCMANYYVNDTSNQCTDCEPNSGYHLSLNDNKCYPCATGCKACVGLLADQCTSCLDAMFLKGSYCIKIPPTDTKVNLVTSAFQVSTASAAVTFSTQVGAIKSDTIRAALYTDSKIAIQQKMSLAEPGQYLDCLGSPAHQVKVKNVQAIGTVLKFDISTEGEIKNETLVLAFGKYKAVHDSSDPGDTYYEHFVAIDGVSLVSTKFDKQMEAAQAPSQAVIGAATSVLMIASAPQAFVMMKIFQSLDFYVYLDCMLPSNFVAFLRMMTSTFFDMLPSVAGLMTTKDMECEKARFAEYDQGVSMFSNLDTFLTGVLIIAGLKLILATSALAVRKARQGKTSFLDKVNGWVNLSIFYGIVEAHHLDIVLSLLIFESEQKRLELEVGGKIGHNFFAAIVLGGMAALYTTMFYKVHKLKKAKPALKPSSEAKSPKSMWEFLLEDKITGGNFIQTHLNLIQLAKDIIFASLLYVGYSQPIVITVSITVVQIVFSYLIMKFKPFRERWMNTQLIITQGVYLLLDILFMTLAVMPRDDSEKARYYYLGFPMIALVAILILASFAFSGYGAYVTIKDIIANLKKNKTMAKEVKLELKDVTADNSNSIPENVNDSNIAMFPEEQKIHPSSNMNKQVEPASDQKTEPKPNKQLKSSRINEVNNNANPLRRVTYKSNQTEKSNGLILNRHNDIAEEYI